MNYDERMEHLYKEVKNLFIAKRPEKTIMRYALIIVLDSNNNEFDQLMHYIRKVKKEEINLFMDKKGVYNVTFTDVYF